MAFPLAMRQLGIAVAVASLCANAHALRPLPASASKCGAHHAAVSSTAQPAASHTSRRTLLHAAAAAALFAHLPAAHASVSIDPEKYGDKELLVAALNKIRQSIGNACAQQPELLPSLLLLTISDALSFQKNTEAGGLDGSILLELERESNEGLKAAAEAVKQIRQNLKRTTQASYADVLALAGAEAIEVAGGPRCLVQIGREDAKVAEEEGLRADLSWENPNAQSIRKAFAGSGLGVQDMVALLGAVGTLQQTSAALRQKAAAAAAAADAADEDDFEQADLFGAEGAVAYGSVPTGQKTTLSVNVKGDKLGKFDSSYFKSILAAGPGSLSPLDSVLLSDKEMRSLVEAYAGSKQKFREDLRSSYARLQALGGNFKGARLLLDN